jgi:NADH kinase
LIEFAKYIKSSYDDQETNHSVSLILEPHAAAEVHEQLPFPIYTTPLAGDKSIPALHDKVDLISTLGGDGTILHAAALFATAKHVPPMLSFSMGSLGFLGNWKFEDRKRAFREVYGSGGDSNDPSWSSLRGKTMGSRRPARVLLRNRLKVSVFGPNGERVSNATREEEGDVYAMNEVVMHRGASPHLTIIDIFVDGQFLTEAMADGMIVSTPTGSTAYSLSSGGSIVHPLVPSLLLTPICPRSLSFRPLLLPANQPITLRLSEKNRSSEVEVSIDGVRRPEGLPLGSEVRVWGESIKDGQRWEGGVPSLVRGAVGGDPCGHGDDPWVGGLNGLLQFNRPFGQDV